jgi:hypothetical protein
MKTYHGDRTQRGCVVTVDGKPLQPRSDLSGNATTAFDWGYVGGGQLSLALLADYFGDDRKAKDIAEAFEKRIVAQLHHNRWTLTESDIAAALVPLLGAAAKRALEDQREPGTAFVGARFQAHDTCAARPLETTAAEDTAAKNRAADDALNAANRAADEAMRQTNRAADVKTRAGNRAADEAAGRSHHVADDAKRHRQ